MVTISFPVPEQSAVDEYEWYLRENFRELDNLLLYGKYDHLTREQHLEGSITVSDDGLFYHDKEQLARNREITLDELTKKINEMTDEELKNLERPKEDTYTLNELRTILIKLKNEKVRATSQHTNVWIYLNTESHTRTDDIIDVLVMMKSLDISFKPGR